MLRRYWPLILIVLAPLVPLWRCVFLGETIGPVDQVAHMAPWNAPAPAAPWDVLQADGVLQFLPWRDMVFKSWGRGELPSWNPYELAGTPLLANSQSGAAYPPHILVGVLHLPTPLGMTLLAWLHLALAGLGVSLLTRRLGGSDTGGAIAGLSFTLSAFLLSWTALPSVIETVAWIPWCLVAVTALIDGETFRPRLRAAAGLALATGMMVLAGHLQFVAYGCLAIGIFAVGRAIMHRPRVSVRSGLVGLALAMLGVAVGFGLAAPQLLPVLQFSQTSHRRNVATEDGYDAYSRSSIRLWELGGVIYPKLNGDPTVNVEVGDPAVTFPSFWPQYAKLGANFAESAIGLGPLVFCLLLCARRKATYWRELSPLVFMGGLALLLALGTPLGRLLYFGIPGWSSTGSPGRASVLVVLVACVAAGVVASQTIEDTERKRRAFAPIAAFVALTLASIYAMLFGLNGLLPAIPSLNVETLAAVLSAATRTPMLHALIAALVTAIAVGLWIRSGRRQAGWLLIPIAIVPFLVLPPLVRSGTNDLHATAAPHERIAVISDNWNLFVIPETAMPSNLAALSQIHELGGYDSLMSKETKDLLDDIDEKNSTPPENGNMLFVKSSANLGKLASAGVTEIWSVRPVPALGTPLSSDNGVYRYSLAGPGRITSPGGPVKIVSESLRSIALQADGPGTLTLRDRMMPGWEGTVDGRPSPVTGSMWRNIELPPGSHEIKMTYTPPGFATGLKVSFGALVLVLFGLFLGLTGRTTARSEAETAAPPQPPVGPETG